MKKILLSIIMLTIICSFLSNSVYASCGGTYANPPGCSTGCQEDDPPQGYPPLKSGQVYCVPNPQNGSSSNTTTSLGPLVGFGPLGEIINRILEKNNSVEPASTKLASVLSTVIGVITICAGFWFMLQILIAGFSYITAGGDKNKIQEAQKKITNSLIGMIIVVGAYALTALIGKILGIPDILNIGKVIIDLGIKP